MLSDIERKILRIICNYDVIWGMPPSINDLCTKTGRDSEDVEEVLSQLNKEQYIQWDSKQPNDIVILERWERKKRGRYENEQSSGFY